MVKLFSVPRCGRLWLLADAFPSPALCVLPALFSPPCLFPLTAVCFTAYVLPRARI